MPLHPQAQEFVDQLKAQEAPSWNEMSPAEGREVFSGFTALFGHKVDVGSVTDLPAAGDVPVRIYRPVGDAPHPALVYFHGGGWVLGDLDTHDQLCRRFAREASCVVVSVDYRRSPEHRYPDALADCLAATNFVVENADQLGVAPDRVAVGGDSAGGSLALGVARLARDRGPDLRFQLLIYPVVERDFETKSYRDFADGYGLTRETMIWFWDQYLGDRQPDLAEHVLPDHAGVLQGLPATHVITAEYDVLRDEGEKLVKLLTEAKVPTTFRRYDGMLHGFVHLWGVFDVGNQAVSDAALILKEQLAS